MSIAEKLQTIAENEQRVYDKGYTDGYENGALPLTQIKKLNSVFDGSTFPENYDLVLHLKKPVDMQYCFKNSNVRSVTLTAVQAGDVMITFAFRDCINLQVFDMKDYKATITDITYAFYNSSKLKSIYGALDISRCPSTTAAFSGCTLLEDIDFVPNTIKVNISFSPCRYLNEKSIQSIIDGLADLTGQTTQTITFHATVGAKLTDEQKATITAKNWTLAY
ncbi:MAG: hypothetical protein E7542_06380 [Ruminococcaceae bacterium]|nr:hypothetical protein [Oscillospiraceae bacterium]